jgi:hypothetical protein
MDGVFLGMNGTDICSQLNLLAFRIFDIVSNAGQTFRRNVSEIKGKGREARMHYENRVGFRKEANSVSGIFRAGSLLMILLLTAPMVHDCCLTVTQAQPCHESKQHDVVTCSARLQAVAGNKPTAVTPSVSSPFYIAVDGNSSVPTEVRCVVHRAVLAPLPANDIYLRTGTLLI